MAAEENGHRGRLIDLYRRRFGDHIPFIRPQDIAGFVQHAPIWMVQPLGLNMVRKQAEEREWETRKFYQMAQGRTSDAAIRKLLGDLAAEEAGHETLAHRLSEKHLTPDVRAEEPRYRGACS